MTHMRRAIPILVSILMPATLALASNNNQVSVPKGITYGLSELETAEGIFSTMERTVGNMNAIITRFRLEDKLVQADLFLEEHKYEKAALLYSDCIMDPAMQGRRDYYPTIFKLSNSLFLQHNYLSALHFFRMLLKPAAGKYMFKGIVGALESSIKLNRLDSAADLAAMAERLLSATQNDSLAYAVGKYYYHIHNDQGCDKMMARVAPNSPYYRRAAYYRAAIAIRARQFNQAINLFDSIAKSNAPMSKGDKEVIAAAYMGKARVLAHLHKLDQALAAYDKVPASSQQYLQALYETAWVYLAKKRPKAAVNILDILLLNLPKGNLSLTAMALKGRILARMNDHLGATEAYNAVTRMLVPVTRELDMLAASPMKLRAYFDWMMSSTPEHFNLDVPLSEVTLRWLNYDPDIRTIKKIFTSLAKQERAAHVVSKGLKDLNYVLQKPAKVDIFPTLRDNYYKVLEVKNRTIFGFSEAVGAAAARIIPYLSARDRQQVLQLEAQRSKAHALIAKQPVTAAQYKAANKRMQNKMMLVEQDVFELETALRILKKQLLGIEDLARRLQIQRKEDRAASITDSIDIEVEKDRLKALYNAVEALRTEVEHAMTASMGEPGAINREAGVREGLLSILLRENALIVSRLDTVPANVSYGLAPMRTMSRRVKSILTRASKLTRQITAMGYTTAKRLLGVLKVQQQQIKQDLADIKTVRTLAKSFARHEGKQVFMAVRKSFTQLLFEAELGRVEMAWRSKNQAEAVVTKLQKEQAKKMKALERARQVLRDLKAEIKAFGVSAQNKKKGKSGQK